VPLFSLVTYAFVPFGLTATPKGELNPVNVVATVFVSVLITETVLSPEFATYTFVPSEVTATPLGEFPTFTTALTLFVAMSITETLLLNWLVIYVNGVAPVILTGTKI
jgi:hypothetical protein